LKYGTLLEDLDYVRIGLKHAIIFKW